MNRMARFLQGAVQKGDSIVRREIDTWLSFLHLVFTEKPD